MINKNDGGILHCTEPHSPELEEDRITRLGGTKDSLGVARSFGDRNRSQSFDPKTRTIVSLIIADPDVTTLQFDQLPENGIIGLLFSDDFAQRYKKVAWEIQQEILRKIGLIAYELDRHYYYDGSGLGLAEKLFLLMDKDRSIDDILHDVESEKKYDWKELQKNPKAIYTRDNVSILAFEFDPKMVLAHNHKEPRVEPLIEQPLIPVKDVNKVEPQQKIEVSLDQGLNPVDKELLKIAPDTTSNTSSILPQTKTVDDVLKKQADDLEESKRNPLVSLLRKSTTAIKNFWIEHPTICYGAVAFAAGALLFKVFWPHLGVLRSVQ